MDNQTKIEITETDITKYSNLKSDSISVFGISIGMSKSEVNKLKDQNKNLYFEVEKSTEFNGEKMKMEDYRIYVYNKKENKKKENRFLKWFFSSEKNSKKDCILYLIWKKKSNILTSITFFEDFKPYLIGLSSGLLTFDTIDSNSKISKEYLGNPDETKVTLDVPEIKLKNISYFFKSKGISITEVNSKNSKKISMMFKNFNKEVL